MSTYSQLAQLHQLMSQSKNRSFSQNKEKKTLDCQEDSTKDANHAERSSLEATFEKKTITLGVCAMKKKVQSKPMKEILKRMKCVQLEIIEMWPFLERHWTQWPKVDALICFHSDEFPYLMAWKYAKKHKPFLINNLQKQQLLWDRSVVYRILKQIKVPVAKHFLIFRDMNYLDEIEKRGFGKILSEELHNQSSVESEAVDKRFSTSSKESHSQNYTGKVKSKIKIGAQTALELNHQRSQTSKDILSMSIEEKDEKRSRDGSQTHERKHKYSEVNIFEGSNKLGPNALRNFHEKRLSSIKMYQIQQVEDHILIRSEDSVQKLSKPFVEKPFDSQNHQICVYYPESMGGGRKMLFRKIKNSSSMYQNDKSMIRRDGNYIYEEFLPTNAFDIKVYTIGAYYMYAEARRSPTLDGVVQRNSEGKQVRYPVILTPDEKFICNRIVQEFGQEVCGLDLLRANGKSFVCDVNGWSFVKANPKYWDDCSIILKKKIFEKFFPEKHALKYTHLDRFSQNLENQYRPIMDRIDVEREELRSIVSIFRHGDRSPKSKMKIQTDQPRFINFFADTTKNEIKLKDEKNLTKILAITNEIIAKGDFKSREFKQFLQMKIVLESGGHFQGFTRKIQLKVLERERDSIFPQKTIIKKIMLVLKWGGQLSTFGYQDSIELGKKMRMERYDANDCLSLYSSYKHDLKTYSSDEGRCIKTAAAFLKGFLNIEGELAPIITSMVRINQKAQRLLDCTSEQNHSALSDHLKQQLTHILNSNEHLEISYLKKMHYEQISQQMLRIVKQIGQPRYKLESLHKKIKNLVAEINEIADKMDSQQDQKIPNNQQAMASGCEDIIIIYQRWYKLSKDFYHEQKDIYNISIIPEIYDTICHDSRRNEPVFRSIDLNVREELKHLSKLLAYFVVPNQYGMTDEERVQTAKAIALPLLEKVLVDLMFWKEKNSEEEEFWKYRNQNPNEDNWRHIRTRLYFSSASHMYSILNVITLGNKRELVNMTSSKDAEDVKNILYMGYLSHIQFRLYEQLHREQNDPDRFRIELSISTGYDKNKKMKQFSLGGQGLTIDKIKQFIQSFTVKFRRVHSESHNIGFIGRRTSSAFVDS